MAVQVKVRFLSSVPPPVPMMLVKVTMLVLVTFERIAALGELPSGSVHCQLNLPSPATVQKRVRLSALVLTGKGTGSRTGESVGTISMEEESITTCMQLRHFCKRISKASMVFILQHQFQLNTKFPHGHDENVIYLLT